MKQTAVKGAIALALAACGACLRTLLVPVAVLAAVMLSDYVTGMLRAWSARELSSRVGLRGLVKKLGYLFAVGVAVVVDLVLQTAGATLGADLAGVYVFALLVTLWLIGNECISILENVSALGVPVPGFLRTAASRLKQSAEEKGEAAMAHRNVILSEAAISGEVERSDAEGKILRLASLAQDDKTGKSGSAQNRDDAAEAGVPSGGHSFPQRGKVPPEAADEGEAGSTAGTSSEAAERSGTEGTRSCGADNPSDAAFGRAASLYTRESSDDDDAED